MAERRRKVIEAPARHVRVGQTVRKTNWLAWLLLACGLLALLVMLARRERDVDTVIVPQVAAPIAGRDGAVALRPTSTSRLGAFLASREPLPRTFVFERLNFDTASSEIRSADRAELAAVATALKQYPGARIRVLGYADARGPSAANAALGAARAASVKGALVTSGVPAVRVEAASGGEADPIDSEATSAGQAGNRRTELVILQR